MAALPLSILALAAGVYLLVKVKREFLGGIFEILSWLVIVLSLVSIGFLGFKAFNHCGGGHCGQARECRVEKQVIMKGGNGHCEMNSSSTCTMGGCKMEDDSVVMEKEMCEKMMGKEACEAMCKERGRCIVSKEECMEKCHAAGKPVLKKAKALVLCIKKASQLESAVWAKRNVREKRKPVRSKM